MEQWATNYISSLIPLHKLNPYSLKHWEKTLEGHEVALDVKLLEHHLTYSLPLLPWTEVYSNEYFNYLIEYLIKHFRYLIE